jgi:YgiT-type zinc finger domain-containing protein
LKRKKQLTKCPVCKAEMIIKKRKIDFLVDQRFITVVNYPILLCPICGEQKIRERDNERVLVKLNEQHNNIRPVSTIRLEEIK